MTFTFIGIFRYTKKAALAAKNASFGGLRTGMLSLLFHPAPQKYRDERG